MRFGKFLHKHKVPIWAQVYLDYSRFKERIRPFKGLSVQIAENPQFEALLSDLSREVEKVQYFYNNAYDSVWEEASLSADHLEHAWHFADEHELRYYLGAFVQCRAELKNLRWYGIVNWKGFRRLLQKLEIHSTVLADIEAGLSRAPFSFQIKLSADLKRVEDAIESITRVLPRQSFSSQRCLILDHAAKRVGYALENADAVYRAIRDDDALALENFLRDSSEISPLIRLSIAYESSACLDYLLRLTQSENGNESLKTHLPWVIIETIIRIGHRKMLADSLDPQLSYIRDSIVSVQVPNRLAFLENLLVTWGSSVQVALSARPSNGRLPVYYAARYGLLDVCQLLKGHMPDANVGDSLLYSDMILLEDRSGISSLSIAVTLDHEEVFEYFLEVLENDGYSNRPNWKSLAGSLLHGAIGSGPKTLGRLLTANADVDYRGVNGETILYAVARSGKATLVGDILSHGASTSIAEGTKGWTPLIVAMVEGHVAMVEMLLQAGADPRYQDFMGWTVLDHAAFRGHNSLAAKLRHLIPSSGPGAISDLKPRPAAPPCIAKNASESVIVVNMGSFDSTKDSTAVDLSLRHQGTPGDLDTEAGFSIRISLIGDQSQSHTVELPILEDMTNRPWAVTTSDPENARLLFQLQRRTTTDTDDKSSYEHLGSAVALLGSLKQCLGHTRESLIRDYTIPILSTATLENIGAITFSFLIVKPFSQPEVNVPKIDMLWDENRQTKVVGHRGHGQNILNPNRLSIGENTKQSVLTAMKMGADLVELDVQLTKDHVPVVYHDFLVSETGIDVWMHHLNLEQLMHISKSQSRPEREAAQQPTHRRSRSYSNDVGEDCRPQHLTEQLKCTFEFKQKGFKANTRGYYIHDSFVTLHNLLSQTPDSIALNIEIKYPMLSEAADEWQSDIYTIEINLFVDTILRDILSHPSCRSRPIMLSSFSPEACIVLSLKQDLFPIWFLSEAGNTPAGDVRASNLQEAIRFATRWNLDGVGIYSDPFVFAPRLVGAAKEKGLMTGSYGILNDDPEGAKVQAAAGIDMLIVDCVRLISQTLSGVHA